MEGDDFQENSPWVHGNYISYFYLNFPGSTYLAKVLFKEKDYFKRYPQEKSILGIEIKTEMETMKSNHKPCSVIKSICLDYDIEITRLVDIRSIENETMLNYTDLIGGRVVRVLLDKSSDNGLLLYEIDWLVSRFFCCNEKLFENDRVGVMPFTRISDPESEYNWAQVEADPIYFG